MQQNSIRHLRMKSTPAAVCWSREEQLGGVQRKGLGINGIGPMWPLVSTVCSCKGCWSRRSCWVNAFLP